MASYGPLDLLARRDPFLGPVTFREAGGLVGEIGENGEGRRPVVSPTPVRGGDGEERADVPGTTGCRARADSRPSPC